MRIFLEKSFLYDGQSFVIVQDCSFIRRDDGRVDNGVHVPRDWARMYRDEFMRLMKERAAAVGKKS